MMPSKINLLDYCKQSTIEYGERLLQSNKMKHFCVSEKDDGNTLIKAKCYDDFNFVDHPKMDLDPETNEIHSFSCDCGEQKEGVLCPHCAALMLLYNASIPVNTPRANIQTMIPASSFTPKGIQPNLKHLNTAGNHSMIVAFSYSFGNSAEDLYPNHPEPEIPLERYKLFFPEKQAELFYESDKPWGGNCYGFSTTSTMFFDKKNSIDYKDFNPNADKLSDLSINDFSEDFNMSLLSFIEAMQISQKHTMIARIYTKSFQNYKRNHKAAIQEICDAVMRFQNHEGDPIVLAIVGSPIGGHALLPYRYDIENHRLDLYDCNYPQEERHLSLIGEDGNYTDWFYEMFEGMECSHQEDCCMIYFPYKSYQEIWDGRKSGNAALFVTPNIANLYDMDDELVAEIKADRVISYREDVMEIMDLRAGNKASKKQLWMNPGSYKIIKDKNDNRNLSFSFAEELQSIQVETSSDSAFFTINDAQESAFVLIPEEHVDYSIQISSSLQDAVMEVLLKGITSILGICIAKIAEMLFQRGIDEDSQETLMVNGKLSSIDVLQNDFPEVLTDDEQNYVINMAKKGKEEK